MEVWEDEHTEIGQTFIIVINVRHTVVSSVRHTRVVIVVRLASAASIHDVMIDVINHDVTMDVWKHDVKNSMRLVVVL